MSFTYRNYINNFSCIIIPIIFFSLSVSAQHSPHDEFFPEWDNISSDTYCSIFSAYEKNNMLISSIQFNYFKKPSSLPIQLQVMFPEVIDYQKTTKLKIFLNNGKVQNHQMFTIDRFERSVWLDNNNEEEILITLLKTRLITVSAISRNGKEYILKFPVYPHKFIKQKNWLYNCIEKDKEYLKYLKKSISKYL